MLAGTCDATGAGPSGPPIRVRSSQRGHRLRPVRVRNFELRLIGSALLACWTVFGALILLTYRPGGPFDLVVGLTSLGPIVIALSRVVWPPVARGDRAFPTIVWLGIVGLLFLVPSIVGVVDQLTGVRVADAPPVGRGGLSVARRAHRDQPVHGVRRRAAAPGRNGLAASPAAGRTGGRSRGDGHLRRCLRRRRRGQRPRAPGHGGGDVTVRTDPGRGPAAAAATRRSRSEPRPGCT